MSDTRIEDIMTAILIPLWLGLFVAWWVGKLHGGALPINAVFFATTGALLVYRLWRGYRRRNRKVRMTGAPCGQCPHRK